MEAVFLSNLYPKEYNQLVDCSKAMPQYAAEKVCNLFLTGIEHSLSKTIDTLNIAPIGNFPFAHKMINIPSMGFDRENGAKSQNIGFCNIYGMRQFSRRKALSDALLSWVGSKKSSKQYIIGFGATQHNLYAMQAAKKSNPNVVTCLIVADLPQFMVFSPSPIYRALKSIDIKMQNSMMHHVDFFVYTCSKMEYFFRHLSKPSIATDGIIDCDTIPADDMQSNINNPIKTILYSGGISDAYGIKELLDAFAQIDDNSFRLQIAGSGDAMTLVNKRASADKRIEYLGLMPNSDLLKIQKKASLLVNPRTSDQEFTNYSFPSKTTEYLASGVPSIIFKLGGIPDEYDSHVHYFKDKSPQTMSRQMKQICELSHQDKVISKENALSFLKNNKDYRVQGKKIIDLITNESYR